MPRRFYSTKDVKDLIAEGKMAPRITKRSRNQPHAKTSKEPMPAALSFDELIRQRKEAIPQMESRKHRVQVGAKRNQQQSRPPAPPIANDMEAFEEMSSQQISSQQISSQAAPRRRPFQIRGSRVTAQEPSPPTEDSWNAAMENMRPVLARAPSGGRSKGPVYKKRGKRFGEEGSDEIAALEADVSEKDLEDEEFWDVDADAMRAMRRLSVWRNPVVGDEPGRPALFRAVKTGYDIFAEERTQFKLNDTTASWGGNRPTSSSQNEVGGPGGNYGVFLPEGLKKMAGIDSTAMKPSVLADLNLALSANLTPRERENAAATVEEILSRAQGAKQKQAM